MSLQFIQEPSADRFSSQRCQQAGLHPGTDGTGHMYLLQAGRMGPGRGQASVGLLAKNWKAPPAVWMEHECPQIVTTQ